MQRHSERHRGGPWTLFARGFPGTQFSAMERCGRSAIERSISRSELPATPADGRCGRTPARAGTADGAPARGRSSPWRRRASARSARSGRRRAGSARSRGRSPTTTPLRARGARSGRTAGRCARRSACSSTRRSTGRARPPACTPTATRFCSASGGRPSCSATLRGPPPGGRARPRAAAATGAGLTRRPAARQAFSPRSALLAALNPHMPCAPAPGGVAAEQMNSPGAPSE